VNQHLGFLERRAGRRRLHADLVHRDSARRAPGRGLDSTDLGAVSAFFERFGEFAHLVLAFSPAADQRQAQFDAAAASVPAGRVATAADVAGAIGYLAGARLATGTILPVDGGFTVA
jgi:hypothetical protein